LDTNVLPLFKHPHICSCKGHTLPEKSRERTDFMVTSAYFTRGSGHSIGGILNECLTDS
jgi:hypothetical protein